MKQVDSKLTFYTNRMRKWSLHQYTMYLFLKTTCPSKLGHLLYLYEFSLSKVKPPITKHPHVREHPNNLEDGLIANTTHLVTILWYPKIEQLIIDKIV